MGRWGSGFGERAPEAFVEEQKKQGDLNPLGVRTCRRSGSRHADNSRGPSDCAGRAVSGEAVGAVGRCKVVRTAW